MAYPIARQGMKRLSERQANITRYPLTVDLPDKQRMQHILYITIYTINWLFLNIDKIKNTT